MGTGFWFKLVGAVIGLGILGLVVFLVFNGLVARLGFLGGFIVIAAIFALIAYRSDKKRQRDYEENEMTA